MGSGKKRNTKEFKTDLATKNPFIEVLGEYVNNITPILVKDKSCGHEWDTTIPNSLLSGTRCPICNNKRKGEDKINKFKNKIIGEIQIMNDGTTAEVINYNKSKDISIKIKETGEIIETSYNDFKGGRIKSHFSPTIFGVGITGIENIRDENNELIESYKCWHHMIERCYSEKRKEKQPTYKDVTCCDEWKYYSNFKKWFDQNYYTVDNEVIALDKDILVKGNKLYSPKNCVFVPQRINVLFVNRKNHRGEYPLGVVYVKDRNIFKARCNIFDKNKTINKHIGYYSTPELAFYKGYKPFKENVIKEVADHYKDKIPDKLHQAMYNYIVEITD
jgi:hypothetical protein